LNVTRDNASKSNELLVNILKQARLVSESAATMNSAIEQQNVASDEVAQSTQHLKTMEEEQTLKSEAVATSAMSLAKLSTLLSGETRKFKV